MLFKHVFAATLATSTLAAAAPVESLYTMAPFDMKPITDAFNAIKANIDKMVGSVSSFDGDKGKLPAIVAASKEIQNAVTTNAAKINQAPALEIMDLLSIISESNNLGTKIDEIVNALARKKAEIQKAGASKTVLEELKGQKASADEMVKVILSKLPLAAIVGPIAQPIAQGITDKIQAGINDWTNLIAGPAAAPAP